MSCAPQESPISSPSGGGIDAGTLGLARQTPQRCVVVEDSESGVTAARPGGFGMVIGVGRTGSATALRELGADEVVSDLSEVRVLIAYP